MQSRVRSRFVRTVIESASSGAGVSVFAALRARLPARLANVLDAEVIAPRQAGASISLDDAEALLVEIDSILGDGSGRVLEEAGKSLAARALTQGGLVASSELGVAARLLQTHLEQAFEGADLQFTMSTGPDAFELTLGIGGRPRAARALRHLSAGYLRAAAIGTGLHGGALRVDSQVIGDRAHVSVRYGEAEGAADRPTPSGPTSKRRPSVMIRAQSGTLAAEVDRILGSTAPPPSRGSGSFPAAGDVPAETTDASEPVERGPR